MRAPLKLLPLVLAGSLALGACGGEDSGAASAETTVTTVASSDSTATTDVTTAKASANDASRDEIAAALTAAGVANADRWATGSNPLRHP
jgi:ABC-type glycerol-3-phosphate transport system substrate-binding protein